MPNSEGFLPRIRTALIRLPLNLRSNRWYVVLGKRLYVRSHKESRAFQKFVISASLASGSPRYSVYRKVFSPLHQESKSAWSNDAILVPHLGRFGNAVREVVSALSVARSLLIGHVYLAGETVFSSARLIASPNVHSVKDDVSLWLGQEPPKQTPFSKLVLWSPSQYRLDENRDAEWSILRDALRLETPSNNTPAVQIHLRGGDIFGSREARNYGQPPLSYYEKVIKHCRPRELHVVHQDERNPVLEPLVKLCADLGIACTLQSSTLLADVKTLLEAKVLIAGRGTFVPAIAGLSRNVRRVYFFEDKFVVQPPRSGLSLYRVSDSSGVYRNLVLSGNWENRADQRELMLSYPASNLLLEKLDHS